MEWLLDLIKFILRQQGVCTIYIQIFTTDTKMDDRESSAGASSQGLEHLDHQQASGDLERWWMLSKTTSYPDLVRPPLLHHIRLANRQLWDWTIMLHQILSSLQNTQTQNKITESLWRLKSYSEWNRSQARAPIHLVCAQQYRCRDATMSPRMDATWKIMEMHREEMASWSPFQ